MHVFNVFLGPLIFGYLEPIQAAFSSLLPRTHSLNRQLCIVKNFPSESVFFYDCVQCNGLVRVSSSVAFETYRYVEWKIKQ